MKSQGKRFLCCIPAVRFGLRRRLRIPHGPGVPATEEVRDNQGDSLTSPMEQYSVAGHAPVQTVPSPETTPAASPEVREPDEIKLPEAHRAVIPAHASKVIVLPCARSAQHRHHRPTGEAKGPALVIPFPRPLRHPLCPPPLQPATPQVVTPQQGLPSRASSEAQGWRQEFPSSFPRPEQFDGPTDIKKCRLCPQKGSSGMKGTPLASRARHSGNKRKTGKRRADAQRGNHAAKPAQTRGEPLRLGNSRPPPRRISRDRGSNGCDKAEPIKAAPGFDGITSLDSHTHLTQNKKKYVSGYPGDQEYNKLAARQAESRHTISSLRANLKRFPKRGIPCSLRAIL